MQQHEAPRKGHSTINLHEYIKSKSNPEKKNKAGEHFDWPT